MPIYTSQYPPAHNDTYVKATTKYSTSFWAYYATDPAKSLTGSQISNSWASANAVYTNQRFHIDLGEAKIIRRIYYENWHSAGTETNRGAYNFVFQGSNDGTAFSTLTYATDTNWTTISVAQNTFDEHSALDAADPKYILATNTTAYRYYAIKISDNRVGSQYMGIRRIELQTAADDSGGSPIFFD